MQCKKMAQCNSQRIRDLESRLNMFLVSINI